MHENAESLINQFLQRSESVFASFTYIYMHTYVHIYTIYDKKHSPNKWRMYIAQSYVKIECLSALTSKGLNEEICGSTINRPARSTPYLDTNLETLYETGPTFVLPQFNPIISESFIFFIRQRIYFYMADNSSSM